MRTLRRFVSLPWDKQRALLAAAMMITTVRAGLTLLSFERLRRYLARLARPSSAAAPSPAEIATVVWSLQTAGRTLPPAGRCLIEALAGHVLLARRGLSTDLRIGVKRDAQGTFMAHAWLEKGERIVLGELGSELEQYTPFPALRGLEP